MMMMMILSTAPFLQRKLPVTRGRGAAILSVYMKRKVTDVKRWSDDDMMMMIDDDDDDDYFSTAPFLQRKLPAELKRLGELTGEWKYCGKKMNETDTTRILPPHPHHHHHHHHFPPTPPPPNPRPRPSLQPFLSVGEASQREHLYRDSEMNIGAPPPPPGTPYPTRSTPSDRYIKKIQPKSRLESTVIIVFSATVVPLSITTTTTTTTTTTEGHFHSAVSRRRG